MISDAKKPLVPAPLVALSAWLVPGAGYFLIREKSRAAAVFSCVVLLFLLGLLIGGIRVATAPASFETSGLLDKPWFMGQILAGPLAIGSAFWAGSVNAAHTATSHSAELGTLYTAVAGMLNLLAIIDSGYRAASGVEPEAAQ